MKKLVVVAPTYNEEANITDFLVRVLSQQDKIEDVSLEVLIVDSHSRDQTPKLVRAAASKDKAIHYLDVEKRGLGLALNQGIDYAVEKLKADLIITMESDLSNDPSQISEFVSALADHDLVVGSRYLPGGKIANWSWWRKILSRGANLILMALAFNFKVHEYTNLYRAFKKDLWLQIKNSLRPYKNWIFVPAFIFETLGTSATLSELPIVYFDRFGGKSKMHTLSYTADLLRYALRYRLQKSARVVKFAAVGGLSFVVNTIILVLGVHLGLIPSVAGPLGAEVAIIVAFALNNLWTFRESQIKTWKQLPAKFIQYNIIAFGSVIIQFVVLRLGEMVFGVQKFKGPLIDLPIIRFYTWYLFFFMWGVGIGMVWNFIMYSKVVWKHAQTSDTH